MTPNTSTGNLDVYPHLVEGHSDAFAGVLESNPDKVHEIMQQKRMFNKVDYTPLLMIVEKGLLDHMDMLMEYAPDDDWSVSYVNSRGASALSIAVMRSHTEIVELLLTREGVDVNRIIDKDETAVHKAILLDRVEIFKMLWSRASEEIINSCLFLAKREQRYEILAHMYGHRADVAHCFQYNLFPQVCRYFSFYELYNFLMKDLPFVVQDGEVVPRQNHNYSWTTFLDPIHQVDDSFTKQALVEEIFEKAAPPLLRRALVQELVFMKDRNNREAWSIPEAELGIYMKGMLYYLGRYEFFHQHPVYISDTAVVYFAYDYGIRTQLFSEHALRDLLEVNGFIKCMKVLSMIAIECKIVGKSRTEAEKWRQEFESARKSRNDAMTESDFKLYCDNAFGNKFKVAMKFMKHHDEYIREKDNHKDLDPEFVITLLPAAAEEEFQNHSPPLELSNGDSIAKYRNVLVMPAGDRTLDDIYRKERPKEAMIRDLLSQIVNATKHLHDKGLIHGDLKSLNILRVGASLKLIDLDAAQKSGRPMGAKFSSGILPPEFFYKLRDSKELQMYKDYWHSNVDEKCISMWDKVKPKKLFVVKCYDEARGTQGLPYSLVPASHAADSWMIGCLLYQLISGCELVSTDNNQDVTDDKIVQAGTWTDSKLEKRIKAKVADEVAVDLLCKLLVVNPKKRLTMDQILAHPFITGKVDISKIVKEVGGVVDALQNVETNFYVLKNAVDNSRALTEQLEQHVIEKLQETARIATTAIYNASEVTTPLSFALLPFRLEGCVGAPDSQDKISSFFETFKGVAQEISRGMSSNQDIGRLFNGLERFTKDRSLYLYLVDDLTGEIAMGNGNKSGKEVYPIEIPVHNHMLLATCMPFIQGGLALLLQERGLLGFFESIGLVDRHLDNEKNDDSERPERLGQEFYSLSIEFFKKACEGQNGDRIRGALLRKLQLWFESVDQERDFCGLQRILTQDGRVLWSATFNKQKDEEDLKDMDAHTPPSYSSSDDLMQQNIQGFFNRLIEEDNAPNIQKLNEHNEAQHAVLTA